MRHVLGRLLCLSLLLVPFRPHAEEPPAVVSKEVSFESEGVTLVGTLFQPAHPRAAVVIVHGSGQEKRMTDFAARLARDDIAVLTHDKRGVGGSGGVYAGPEVGTNNVDAANLALLAADAGASVDALVAHYAASAAAGGWVSVEPATESGKLDATALNDTNKLELRVFGNDSHHHAVLIARLDNLGKGASGAAVQNLQLMLGV